MNVLSNAKVKMPIANWIMDCITPCYDSALVRLGYPKADIGIMNTGGLRGNGVYEPGKYSFTLLMRYKIS